MENITADGHTTALFNACCRHSLNVVHDCLTLRYLVIKVEQPAAAEVKQIHTSP